MPVTPAYDRIGIGYATTRQPDPRIAHQIDLALGETETVVNVGAGAGSYEPVGRRVIAVEPSIAMIRQRPTSAAPAVQGVAESLPFSDRRFDAALAILTMHHWTDQAAGLAELRRVARERVVLLTWDLAASGSLWLMHDYFPEMIAVDAPRFPPIARVAEQLGATHVVPVPVPADCVDGFLGAFWARPERYLDPAVRAAISAFVALPDDIVERGVQRLANDLESGAWDRRYPGLREQTECDLGYRLIVSNTTRLPGSDPTRST